MSDTQIIIRGTHNMTKRSNIDVNELCLSLHTSVTILSLTKINLEPHISLFSKSLSSLPNLITLSLVYNNLGNEGIEQVCKSISNIGVKNLSLINNRYRHLGVKYIANLLKVNKNILTLDLTNNVFGNKGLKYLSKGLTDSNVTDIVFFNNHIGGYNHDTSSKFSLMKIFNKKRVMYYFTEMLKKNVRIRYLDFQNNNLDDADIEMILPVLKNNRNIEVLMLGCNNLSSESLIRLSLLLEDNSKLYELDLSENNLYEADDKQTNISHFAYQVSKSSILTHLSLENTCIRDEHLLHFLKIIKTNTYLLNLSYDGYDNQITKKVKKLLVRNECIFNERKSKLYTLCLNVIKKYRTKEEIAKITGFTV